jgi:hypothetical protein
VSQFDKLARMYNDRFYALQQDNGFVYQFTLQLTKLQDLNIKIIANLGNFDQSFYVSTKKYSNDYFKSIFIDIRKIVDSMARGQNIGPHLADNTLYNTNMSNTVEPDDNADENVDDNADENVDDNVDDNDDDIDDDDRIILQTPRAITPERREAIEGEIINATREMEDLNDQIDRIQETLDDLQTSLDNMSKQTEDGDKAPDIIATILESEMEQQSLMMQTSLNASPNGECGAGLSVVCVEAQPLPSHLHSAGWPGFLRFGPTHAVDESEGGS